MNSMPEMKYTPQLTPRSDYHSHDKSSVAKPKFDSIVRDEHSKAVSNELRNEDIHSERRAKQDDEVRMDDPSCSQGAAAVENRMREIREGQERQRAEEVETRSMDAKDAETETDSENGLKLGALLNELINKYATGDTAAETNSENGLKVGALLNELMNKYAAAGSGSGTDSENGLKIGALLNELISKYAEVESGTETNSENGLKVGALLNELISKCAAGSEGGPELNELINIGPAKEGKSQESKDVLKTDLLNRLLHRTGSNDLVKIDAGEKSALSADQTINIKAGQSGSEVESPTLKTETPAQVEEALKQMNSVQTKGADGPNAQGQNSGVEGLQNKLMSGLADQFSQGSSAKNDSFNFTKSMNNAGNDSSANNINLHNSANTASDAAGSVKHTFSVNDVKTPAFKELLDNVVYVIKDNKMGVTVEHDNFGKLNINLSMDKGMVNVHINTSDNAVREFLENNIQQIVDSLNKDGVSVGEFSIALKDRREGEGNDFSSNNGQVKEHLHETKKEHRGSGLVNIFA